MADYISREAAIEYFRKSAREIEKLDAIGGGAKAKILSVVVEELGDFPAADVEPARHGRWVPSKLRNEIERCSNCRKVFRHPSFYGYKFCPNCGAKMDLEDKKK